MRASSPMRTWVLGAIALFFLALTVLLLHDFVWRVWLPYNEMGRYFDSDYAVVYHEQNVPVIGILTAISALIAAGSAWGAYRAWSQ